MLYYTDLKIPSMDLRQYLDLLKKNFPQLRYERTNIVPSKVFTLDVDRQAVLAKGIIPKGMDSLVVDQMRIRLKGTTLEKKDLAFLDVLTTNNWERPIYLNNTSLAQLNLDMRDFVVQEGNAYRVLPVRNNRTDRETLVNVESSYKKMLHDFGYRGLDNPKLYYNEDYRGFIQNHRGSLNSLAEAIIDQGDLTKAKEVIDFNLAKMPDAAVRYDITSVSTAEQLFRVGEKARAVEMATLLGTRAEEMVNYELKKYTGISMEVRRNLYILGELQRILYENGESDLAKKFESSYERILEGLQIRGTDRSDY